MLVDFQQKQQIIHHIADARNWENAFDMSFFDDPKRKMKERLINGLSVSFHLADTVILISHLNLDINLEIRRIVDGVGITTGDDQLIIVNKNMRSLKKGRKIKEKPFNPQGNDYAYVQDFMIAIDDDGVIDLQMPELDRSVQIKPRQKPQPKQVKQGRYFHKISFNYQSQGQAWNLDPISLLLAAKLIIARELGIEPNLWAMNALDEQGVYHNLAQRNIRDDFDRYMHKHAGRLIDVDKLAAHDNGAEELRDVPSIATLEKPWADATDFGGFRVETPRLFCVRKSDSSYDFYVRLGHKEQLINLSDVIINAQENRHIAPPLQSNRDDFSVFFEFLDQGQELTDPTGNQWRYTFLEYDNPAQLAQSLRAKCHDHYGVSRQDLLAVATGPNHCLIAMRTDKIDTMRQNFQATRELSSLLDDNSKDFTRFKEVLEAGADIRFLDRDVRKIKNKAFEWALKL